MAKGGSTKYLHLNDKFAYMPLQNTPPIKMPLKQTYNMSLYPKRTLTITKDISKLQLTMLLILSYAL